MTATAWSERCKTLAHSVIEACALAPVAAGPGALSKEVQKRLPEYSFRQVLCRGGWYRLGGVVDTNSQKIADNLEQWAEAALDECDGDIAAVLENHAGSGLKATRLHGRTHYLVAPAGSGAADFL
ncbi:hypothetical protein EG831_05515, partial [bacterium]|nr:hypothetical protein [bacterium]